MTAIQKAIEALIIKIWDDTVSMGIDRGMPHVADMAQQALALLKAEGWQPIATCPKDGSWFWIQTKVFGVKLGRVSLDPEYGFEFFEPRFAGVESTHHLNAVISEEVYCWHSAEIPAPPNSAAKGGG